MDFLSLSYVILKVLSLKCDKTVSTVSECYIGRQRKLPDLKIISHF